MSFLLWENFVEAEDFVEIVFQPDIDQGRKKYQASCFECHGVKGHGDGPRATTLPPRPGNRISAATFSKTDEELLGTITNGIQRSSMQSNNDRLTLDDRRNVLAYIRFLVHF